MTKKLKPYLTFTKNCIQSNLAYRANTIIFFLGEVMLIAVTFFLWIAIYRSSSESIIKGFNINEMVVYVILSFVTAIITSADIMHLIYREVKDGSIATYLMKPIDYQIRLFFHSLGQLIYNFVIVFIIGFSVVIFLSIKYNLPITLTNIALYLLSSLFGFLISFFYTYGFGLLAFKITNMWGLNQIMGAIFQLLSGALVPLVFFPKLIQKLLDFLPFKSMIYTPCMIFLGKYSMGEIIYSFIVQIIWIILMYALSKAIWKSLIKQLTILGG